MARPLIICLLAVPALAACGPDIPALDARLGPEARAADFPELVPLGPISGGVDTAPAAHAATEGQSLEARTAEPAPPRRRAARDAALSLRPRCSAPCDPLTGADARDDPPEASHDRPVRLGIAGLGTVGTGVVKIVQRQANLLARRCGRPVVITAVSARSRDKDRGVSIKAYAWEDDPVALASRDDVDVFVELMGGEDGPAKAATEAAIAPANTW
jgi:hypothetical protein